MLNQRSSAATVRISATWISVRTSGGFHQRVYGFERPGGVAIFIFGGAAAGGAPQGWDEALASFTDAAT